ncbi:sensor domain-containing diguanylate cyclase [Leucothrix pacifica]|uniref:diguanylate cyclase n=1 Tax=Leucothrix pacifica TaxID=1247513 RepID=A0A317CGY7_9GAMM|nr:diguanylate cyclase [Leucothrix pacifica]PWQ97826.1 hypothetical protein DKW60_09550 [Leucothrix pacifica]
MRDKTLFNYFGRSIKRLVMASFVFVLLLPIMFFLHSLFQNSWHQVEQKMLEKHQLISEALVEPLTLFVTTRQQSLQTIGQELTKLSNEVAVVLGKEDKRARIQYILDTHQKSFGNFVALSYSSTPHSELSCISTAPPKQPGSNKPDYSHLKLTGLPAAANGIEGQDAMSPVFASSISGKPVVLIQHKILNQHSIVDGMLYAEISLEHIASICSKIDFGGRGHCAVVDNIGQVVAHPSPDWVDEVKDLSKLSIVQKMLAGQSGTAEFYSPALKTDMVAGFSAIPKLGWGVMIPQSKAELTEMLDHFRLNTLIWLAFGVLVALLMAGFLTRKITRPINRLIRRTNLSAHSNNTMSIGRAPDDTPSEIKQLWSSFSNLLTGLQQSNREIKRLNLSLQEEIEIATTELRQANKDLYKTSTQDYLTSLSNRRHFTDHLEAILEVNTGHRVGIIIIDMDNFKQVNDLYGHETGDIAIKHLATILKDCVRNVDLAARLGGDEFVVYINDATDQEVTAIAEKIRQSVQESPLHLSGLSLSLTLSIGTVNQTNEGGLSLQTLLSQADKAMYRAKTSGRNKIVSHPDKETSPEKPKQPQTA